MMKMISAHVVRKLAQPAFHSVSGHKRLHKELTESLAMLEALEAQAAGPEGLDSWHVLDLC